MSIITAAIKLIRFVKRWNNIYDIYYAGQDQDKKVSNLNRVDTESPFPIKESSRQNMHDAPQGSNSFSIGENDNQNLFEEDKKDGDQLHNSAIL